jgi:hypothetical protein
VLLYVWHRRIRALQHQIEHRGEPIVRDRVPSLEL